MKSLSPYLTFNGNCREAMLFYQQCFGGELYFQTVGEAPVAEKIPAKMRNYILHARLSTPYATLMASDIVGDEGLVKGNSVSVMIECATGAEIKALYKKLVTGGISNHPVELTHWGALFGDLTDKFGNQWLLHYQK